MRSTTRIITIALLLLALTTAACAQDVRFHDAQGRVTGSARTDANGATTFHDASRMSALGANRTRRDGGNDVNDPNRTESGLKSRSAAVSCRTDVCYLSVRSTGATSIETS